MKRLYLSTLILSLLFFSCKDAGETETMELSDNAETTDTSYMDSSDSDEMSNETSGKSYSREEASDMADQMKSDVEVDENNNISIKNFTAYGQLQNEVKNLSIDPAVRSEMNTEKAKKAFETFKEEMPSYLNTYLVRKEIADTEKAMEKMYGTLNKNDASEKMVKKHINKVKSAVNDLNDEIADVRLSMDQDVSIDFDSYTDFVNNVSYDDSYVVTIVDFTDYETVKKDREMMNQASGNAKDTYAQSLIKDFDIMVSRMPQYLKIDDVEEAVRDVQKEMNEYQNEKNTANISMEENLENLEEIDEALYDLNKELVKARNKYDRKENNAIEIYMEELNR